MSCVRWVAKWVPSVQAALAQQDILNVNDVLPIECLKGVLLRIC